jgi:NAD(P)-dependent dehydrogenase (short-subunit alcohol dehydrogenase family)
VTGGGTGIGKAIATAFAQAGAKSVTILGRRLDRLHEAVTAISATAVPGSRVFFEQADLQDRKQVDIAVKTTTDRVGKIDILVSNAASMPGPGLLLGYDATALIRGFQINVLTTFNVMQSFVPVAGPEPIVINVSTCLAHMSPFPGTGGYSIVKAAALKMVDYFAAENPQLHVVNIHPGFIATEANDMHPGATDTGRYKHYRFR